MVHTNNLKLKGREFFTRIAYPLYQRHQADGASEHLLWAAIISLNHVADYCGMRPKDDQINALRDIASALEHSKPHRSGEGKRVEPQTLSSDFLSISDVFAEPNIFATWVIEIDGKTCSIGPVLKSAVDFWTNELEIGQQTASQGA